MRKIWFILLMMCTIGAMTACSDDDDDNNGGKSPVSGVYLPAEGQLGQEIEIIGEGFTSTAEFFLKDASGNKTPVTGVKVAADKVKLTVPASLEPGKYTLVLKQDGEWTLGTLEIVKGKLKVTRLSSFIFTMDLGYEGIEPTDMVYRVTYDEQNRVKSFSTTVDNGDGAMEMKSVNFEYTDNMIKATGNMFDDFSPMFNLVLDENGRVKGCTINGKESTWEYTTDGYLDKIRVDGTVYDYNFIDGNLMFMEAPNFGNMGGNKSGFLYGNDKNSNVTDVVNFILSSFGYSNGILDPQFCAYLLGKAGKVSSNLPSVLQYWDINTEIEYHWNKENGNLESLYIPFEMSYGEEIVAQRTTIAFKYETAEIDQ